MAVGVTTPSRLDGESWTAGTAREPRPRPVRWWPASPPVRQMQVAAGPTSARRPQQPGVPISGHSSSFSPSLKPSHPTKMAQQQQQRQQQQPINHTPLASQAPGEAARQQAARPRASTAAVTHARQADPAEAEASAAGLQKALEAVVDTGSGVKASGTLGGSTPAGVCLGRGSRRERERQPEIGALTRSTGRPRSRWQTTRTTPMRTPTTRLGPQARPRRASTPGSGASSTSRRWTAYVVPSSARSHLVARSQPSRCC